MRERKIRGRKKNIYIRSKLKVRVHMTYLTCTILWAGQTLPNRLPAVDEIDRSSGVHDIEATVDMMDPVR